MAVITRYIVVRNGVELDQVFEGKKEADAYDKMLDAAENLAKFIKEGVPAIDLDDKIIEDVAVFLSKNGTEVTKILRGIKPAPPPPAGSDADLSGKTVPLPVRGGKTAAALQPGRQKR